MFHSDRGSQYASLAFRNALKGYGMVRSRGWPRARAMESFFGTLKTECLHHFKFKTRDQARQVVFDYIEVFYNRIRRHATIQNAVPADYAREFYKNDLQIAA